MRHLRRIFLSGVLVLVPIVTSLWILTSLMFFLDSILGRLLVRLFNISIPGLGLISLIVIILITGTLTQSLFGNRLIAYLRNLLTRIPFLNKIYEVTESISNSLLGTDAKAFRQVVLVPFPNEYTSTIGFVTSAPAGLDDDKIPVYVPTVPNITTGFYLLYPKEKVRYLDLTVQEGIRLAISAGIIAQDKKKESTS